MFFLFSKTVHLQKSSFSLFKMKVSLKHFIVILHKNINKMDYFEKLSELNREQKELLQKYTSVINDISALDVLNENKKLKEDHEKLNKRFKELEETAQKLANENRDIRNALVENVIDEKLQIVKISKEKLELFFKHKMNESANRLSSFENEIKRVINELENKINKEILAEKTEMLQQLTVLTGKLNQQVRDHMENLRKEKEEIYLKMSEGMKGFQEEGVDEETIKKRIRQNKIEMNIGLGWFNKIGIVLILISIGLFAYYNRGNIDDHIKGIVFFVLGFAFLVTGELFYRRNKNYFAQGMIGGGIAILFASIFSSSFILGIISQNSALIFSIILSFFTISLALRYKSQSIIALGLVGGYLPFIAYHYLRHFSGADFYYGMTYLLVINLITLSISFRMKWVVIHYLSFILFLPSLIFLAFKCPDPWVGIVFTFLSFLIYKATILVNPMIHKTRVLKADIIMFSVNTISSSLILFLLFEKANLENLEGLLSLVLCVIYYLTGRLINQRIPEDRALSLLSYVTSLTFGILIIPFQFGAKWLSIGWLVESILLIVFGIYRKMKHMERTGLLVFGLCLISFYFSDLTLELFGDAIFFTLKFFFITAGLVFVYLTYHFEILKSAGIKSSGNKKLISILNVLAAVNLFFFTGYILNKGFNNFIAEPYQILPKYASFYHLFLWSLSAFSIGQVFRNKLLQTEMNRIVSILLVIATNVIFLYMITAVSVLPSDQEDQFRLLGYLSFAVLIIFNIIIVYSIRETVIRFFKYNYTNLELLPLSVAIFLMLNISIIIIKQFHFYHTGLILSLSYIILAICCIIFGFLRKYTYIRYFGLGLTFFSLGKLLIWDLKGLDETGKIIAYFSYGVLLIGISFIYQQIQKKITVKTNSDEMEK